MEQRGVAVVTTSGVLVTLIFGLAAFAIRRDRIELSEDARAWLYLSLLGFIVAACAALLTNLPRTFESVKTYGHKSLDQLIEQRSHDSDRVANRRMAHARIKILDSYKRMNIAKARLLMAAIIAEVVAVGAVAVTVAFVIGES